MTVVRRHPLGSRAYHQLAGISENPGLVNVKELGLRYYQLTGIFKNPSLVNIR